MLGNVRVARARLTTRATVLNRPRATRNIPKHRVKWEFPHRSTHGQGKKLFGNASGLLDKLIGGWQLAGVGSLRSTYFSLPASYWNFTGEPVHIYGYKYPIETAAAASASGLPVVERVHSGQQINSHDASGKPTDTWVSSGLQPARRR